jgi:ribosome-associated protein
MAWACAGSPCRSETGAVKGPDKRKNAKPSPGTPSRRKRRTRRSAADSARLLEIVCKSLDDDMAEDIVAIDLAGKTAIADHMVIASGRNARHIGAMADHLKEKIKAAGLVSPPIEGDSRSDWVLIDGGDVIVHLFRPETRTLYNLEKMWGVDWTDSSAGDGEDADAAPPATAGT